MANKHEPVDDVAYKHEPVDDVANYGFVTKAFLDCFIFLANQNVTSETYIKYCNLCKFYEIICFIIFLTI